MMASDAIADGLVAGMPWDGPGGTAAADAASIRAMAQTIRDDQMLNEVLVNDQGVLADRNGTPIPTDSPTFVKIKEALGAAGKFLTTNDLGKALTQLGLGAAGLGIGRLVAGGGSSLTLPPSTAGQNPIVGAAQPALLNSLAEGGNAALQTGISANLTGQARLAQAVAAEIERAAAADAAAETASAPVRSLALSQLPEYMQGTAPHPSAAYDQVTDQSLRQLELIYGLPKGTLGRASQPPRPAGTAAPGATTGTGVAISDAALEAKGIFSADLKAQIRANPDLAKGYGFTVPAGATPAAGNDLEAQFAAKNIQSSDLKAAIKADPKLAESYGIQLTTATAPAQGETEPAELPGGGTLAGVTNDPNLPGMQERLKQIIAGGPEAYAKADPIEAQMAAKLERALRGEEVDPAVERTIQDELEKMRNSLKLAYGNAGAEWESTPGQNLYLKGLESAAAMRHGVNQNIVNSLGPQEFQRRSFSIRNPMDMYLSEAGFYGPETFRRGALPAAETRQLLGLHQGNVQGNAAFNENARQAGVAQSTALANFNRPSLASSANILNSQWAPFGQLTGTGEPNTFPILANAATRGFEAEQAARAATARDVAGVFGRAASSLLPRPTFQLSPTGAFTE